MGKPLMNETNIVIEYIRQKTETTNEWIQLGSRDIPKLFNISQKYSLRILEAVKAHPNIIYGIDEDYPTRFKPYIFKWVETELEKIIFGLSESQFFWLLKNEVSRIKTICKNDDYNVLFKILRLCNLLASSGAKKWWINIDIENMSDLLLASQNETRNLIDRLVQEKLIFEVIKNKNIFYKLTLDDQTYDTVKLESESELLIKPKKERKKRKQFNVDKSFLATVDNDANKKNIMAEKIKENSINIDDNIMLTSENGQYTNLERAIENVKMLEHITNAAMDQIQYQIQLLTDFKKLESENNNKQKLIIKNSQTESQQLHDFTDFRTSYMHEYMDIMLKQISGLVDEYVITKKDNQDETVNSEFKNNVSIIVSNAIDKIVNYKQENNSVEG